MKYYHIIIYVLKTANKAIYFALKINKRGTNCCAIIIYNEQLHKDTANPIYYLNLTIWIMTGWERGLDSCKLYIIL